MKSLSYEQRKHGLAMNGNTDRVIVNCGETGSYSDVSVGMDSGDKMNIRSRVEVRWADRVYNH